MKNNSNNNTKVFVALSGGVDSAVSAALLKEQGYDVTGVYMKNWSGDDFGIQSECPWEVDQADAEAVCKHLNIPFRSFNFEKQYRDKVVEYFFEEYKKGRTPNPDVMCNKEIKFKLFLDKAIEEGADLIATGHYARRGNKSEIRNSKFEIPQRRDEANSKFKIQIEEDKSKNPSPGLPVRWPDGQSLSLRGHAYRQAGRGMKGEGYSLLTGKDDNKNQVYFLYNITQDQLSKTLFPIGEYPKFEVRKLAEKFGLPNSKKPDSQGICFIGEINVLQFLMSRIPKNPGKIVDIETGEEVGEHEGIYFYTIGQRAKIANQTEAYFYCKKDAENNVMYVCHGHDNPALFSSEVELENLHLISHQPSAISQQSEDLEISLQAAIRYRQIPQSGKLQISKFKTQNEGEIDLENAEIKFIFDEPQRAVASGQSLVLFDGEICLGGGVIK